MSQLTHELTGSETKSTGFTDFEFATWRWYVLPLVFAFTIDLLAPSLIGWRILPRAVLWLSDIGPKPILRVLLKQSTPPKLDGSTQRCCLSLPHHFATVR